jgi:hypothetical protein
VPVAAATVMEAEAGPQFGELSAGPFVEGTEQAIRRGEAIPEVRNGRFEAFLLMIPSLYVVALWLKDLDGDGGSDLILTIPPAHSDLVPFEPMNPADFTSILNQLAQKALADAAAR